MPRTSPRLPIAILLLASAILGLGACTTQRAGTPGASVTAGTLPVLPHAPLIDLMDQLLAPVLRRQPHIVLLGEQHDAPQHHQLEQAAVASLVRQGRLGALALEMAERGRSTTGLPPGASEEQVQRALGWNEAAWPWAHYGPGVMQAVRESIPVLGANLPRHQQRDAMKNIALDGLLSAESLQKQEQSIIDGHCGLLAVTHIRPMTRIQIARDQAMAQTLAEAARRQAPSFEQGHLGRPLVLLLAGRAHVDRQLGIPRHVPADLAVGTIGMVGGLSAEQVQRLPAPGLDAVWPTEAAPAKDYCSEFSNSRPTPASPS